MYGFSTYSGAPYSSTASATSFPTTVFVSGVGATVYEGTPTVTGTANVFPVGLYAQARLGTVVVTNGQGVNVPVALGPAMGYVGDVYVTGTSTYQISGVSAQTYLGSVVATGGATSVISGLSATGYTGSVFVSTDYIFGVTGVYAQTYLGNVKVRVKWGDIDDTQTPSWQDIANMQAQSWAQASTSQDAGWQAIDNQQPTAWSDIDDTQPNVWTPISTQ